MFSPDFWSGKRVFITGHNGFKGSWLSLWLSQLQASVIGYSLPDLDSRSLFYQYKLSDSIQSVNGDIRDFHKLKSTILSFKPDVVFHLAAQPLVRASYHQPLETWQVNVQGTVNLLEVLRQLDYPCSSVFITTDKVYHNNEWTYGYREVDPLGGYDPYSSSKAASEIAISSWRSSFSGIHTHQLTQFQLASARSGNVIGGGDFAADRIVPDAIRSLINGTPIPVRNPSSTRPWQHVLDPLHGYLLLAEKLYMNRSHASSYNFGPSLSSNRSVSSLVTQMLKTWNGTWIDVSDPSCPHEAVRLNLATEKAFHELSWTPTWDFATTVHRTTSWYKDVHSRLLTPLEASLQDLRQFHSDICNDE